MLKSSSGFIALVTLMVWPVVPMFWIPVHGFSRIFRNRNILAYAIPAIGWPPLAYLIHYQRGFLLHYKADFGIVVNTAGMILLIAGILLHLWTGKLLGLPGLIGLPEISQEVKGRLITEGPFSIVRHPTYLAHTIIFSGAFLFTGVTTVGLVVLIDFILINTLIVPLEDKELISRFGDKYKEYKKLVRWRILPGIL